MHRTSKLALGALALACSFALAACGGHPYAERHPEKAYRFVSYRVESVLDDLEANDAQRDRVHAVKDRVYDDMKALRASTRKAGREAIAELKKSSVDAEKLHGMVDARMNDMRDKMHGLVDGLIEIHGTLTPEQRAELIAMIEERIPVDEAQ
jgi:Spy/CpxP family protein refolding chaperone